MSVLNAFVRLALAAVPREKLSILIFHRVLPSRDPLRPSEPTAEEFERQLLWVKSWFNIVPLSEAVRALKSSALPDRSLAITFDDGYADNYEVALPVLRRLGLPATYFIATGYLDGGVMFNDRVIEAVRQARGSELDLSALGLGAYQIADDSGRRAAADALLKRVKYLPQREREERVSAIVELCHASLPSNLMMRSEQVAALSALGIEVGAHTVSHPILKELDHIEARREIVRGRVRLEEITGKKVALFAYPNGRPGQDYSAEHVALVRESGFDGAVSTAWGTAGPGSDLFQLPRFTPWDRQAWRYGLRMARMLAKRQYDVAGNLGRQR